MSWASVMLWLNIGRATCQENAIDNINNRVTVINGLQVNNINTRAKRWQKNWNRIRTMRYRIDIFFSRTMN